MAPTIRIDEQVYGWLQSQARPFEDTPNSVLRRIAKLDDGEKTGRHDKQARRVRPVSGVSGNYTPQKAFRAPLLMLLEKHNGHIHRGDALKELEAVMSNQLTEHDKDNIASGAIRWQKAAEWEVRVMREDGLLKPVSETPRGVWALT